MRCGKILHSRAGHRWQYGACALHAGYLDLHTHTHIHTHTHTLSLSLFLSEYIILTAFTLQQWLHERSSMLRYTHIHCLSCAVYIQLAFQVKWWIHWAGIQIRSPWLVSQWSTKLFPDPFREKSGVMKWVGNRGIQFLLCLSVQNSGRRRKCGRCRDIATSDVLMLGAEEIVWLV